MRNILLIIILSLPLFSFSQDTIVDRKIRPVWVEPETVFKPKQEKIEETPKVEEEELAVVENKQDYDLKKDEQEHRQILEVDQQEHDQEMAKLKLEHEIKAHRYCEHEWGDADHDGQLECQKCGLFKPEWDDTH